MVDGEKIEVKFNAPLYPAGAEIVEPDVDVLRVMLFVISQVLHGLIHAA